MIRSLRSEDLDTLMEIWLDANVEAHSFIDGTYWKSHVDAVREALPRATVYVEAHQGAARGFVGLTDGRVDGLFVSAAARSKGIGKALLDHVKDKNDALSLRVYKKNDRAMRFYIREGFAVAAEQTEEHTGETECLMKWERG